MNDVQPNTFTFAGNQGDIWIETLHLVINDLLIAKLSCSDDYILEVAKWMR